MVEARLLGALRQAQVPLEYRDVSLAPDRSRGDGGGVPASIRPVIAATTRNIRRFVREGRQLVLLGAIGVGKSCVMGVIARAACSQRIHVRYASVPQVCALIHGDNASIHLTAMSRLPLLLLDDLGAEYGTDFNLSRLAELIEERWAGRRATVVSSNLTRERLIAEYPGMERAWDRLFDARRTQVLVIAGKSRRKRGAMIK